jgi:hypothetical protein
VTYPLVLGVRKNATTDGGPTMSVIVINPKNRHEIIYTEEEHGKAYIESCLWYRAFENAVDASDEDQRDLVK